jgi:hypothetical protein
MLNCNSQPNPMAGRVPLSFCRGDERGTVIQPSACKRWTNVDHHYQTTARLALSV